MPRLFWACVAASLACACSVITSLDQLSLTDGGVDAGTDVGVDSSIVPDAATDTIHTDTGSAYVFADDFNRSATDGGLGNGWVSKDVSFELGNAEVTRVVTNALEYQDNVQTRPASESVGDVEVSIELVMPKAAPCSPQIHARVDTSTVAIAGTLDSYMLYLDNDGTYTHWIIGRQHGGQPLPDTIATLTASSAVQDGVKMRLTLRVQGKNPVTLFGSIERYSGSMWETLASTSTSDSTGLQITKDGVVGFGAGKGTGYETTGEYSYDNFSAKGL
jgi:hypothetical protein